jgi:hypothetical protein
MMRMVITGLGPNLYEEIHWFLNETVCFVLCQKLLVLVNDVNARTIPPSFSQTSFLDAAISLYIKLSLIPSTSTNIHYSSWRELPSYFPFLWHFLWYNFTWQA